MWYAKVKPERDRLGRMTKAEREVDAHNRRYMAEQKKKREHGA